jgi:hypothetical protein
MPAIDLSILNQRQTPAFYADTLANRPAAGFVGRIFVSTDTFAFYRDNGTTWDLIGGPGTGTVTGTGANGQVTYWNGASTITGSNDLFFDAVNGHLGIGTVTPGTALDVKHDQSTVVQLEQITATNDIRIAFINSGVGLWRLGAFYNAGANDFGLFDIAAATQPVTVKRTTGQVLIGTSTVGSGKLVVASATGDNGVQIVGAAAPSLRIDNAESGPTKRAGLGISTAANNFIQGSADRDFCIFNGSTTASPILFGVYATTNVQEAARISSSGNLLVNTTVDNGKDFQVSGTGSVSSSFSMVSGQIGGPASYNEPNGTNGTLQFGNYTGGYLTGNIDNYIYKISGAIGSVAAQSLIFQTRSDVASGGFAFIAGTTPSPVFRINSSGEGTFTGRVTAGSSMILGEIISSYSTIESTGGNGIWLRPGGISSPGGIYAATTGNLLIGTTTDSGEKLQVNGTSKFTGNLSATGLRLNGSDTANTIYAGSSNMAITAESGFTISIGRASDVTRAINVNTTNGNLLIGTTTNGGSKLKIVGLPTSASGLSSGDVYSNLGILTIVP